MKIEIDENHYLTNRDIEINDTNRQTLLTATLNGIDCGAVDSGDQHFGWRLLERKLNDAEQKELDELIEKFVGHVDCPTFHASYIDWRKIPEINGCSVESIWCNNDFAYSNKDINENKWRFNCYPDPEHKQQRKLNEIGKLSVELRDLFGEQRFNGGMCFVRHLSFKTNSSHTTSSNIMTVYTAPLPYYNNGDTVSVYLKNASCEYVLKVMRVLGKKYTIK